MFRTKKDIEGNEQLNKYIKYNTFYKAQDTNLSKSESKNTLLNLKNQIISKICTVNDQIPNWFHPWTAALGLVSKCSDYQQSFDFQTAFCTFKRGWKLSML